MWTFCLDRIGARSAGVVKSRGVGNPQGCPRLVPRRGAKRLVHAAAVALATAAAIPGQANAATDAAALAQRAQMHLWNAGQELVRQELSRKGINVNDQTRSNVDEMNRREREAIERHARDLERIPGAPPAVQYRPWRP